MIVTITGSWSLTDRSYSLNDVPKVYFDEEKSWEMRVVQLCAVFDKPAHSSAIFHLSSSLIKQSNGNPKQIIACGIVQKDIDWITVAPTQSAYYKMRFHQLESSEFRLTSCGQVAISPITATLQLEIRESNNDWF